MKVCCTNTQEPSEGFPVNYILRFVNDVLSAARVKNQIKSELKAANTLLLLVRRINPPLLAVISHRESFSLGQWIDLQDLSAAHFIFYRKRVQSRAGAQHTAKDPDWLSLAQVRSSSPKRNPNEDQQPKSGLTGQDEVSRPRQRNHQSKLPMSKSNLTSWLKSVKNGAQQDHPIPCEVMYMPYI